MEDGVLDTFEVHGDPAKYRLTKEQLTDDGHGGYIYGRPHGVVHLRSGHVIRDLDSGGKAIMTTLGDMGKAAIRALVDNEGKLIPRISPASRVIMKTGADTGSLAGVKEHFRLVGTLGHEAISSINDKTRIQFPESPWKIPAKPGRISQYTVAEASLADGHEGMAFKFPFSPKSKSSVDMFTRDYAPKYKGDNSYKEVRDYLIHELRADGFTVTEKSWKAQITGPDGKARNRMHRGLVISKRGLLDQKDVSAKLKAKFSEEGFASEDVEDVKYLLEAINTLDMLPEPNRKAFLTWWNQMGENYKFKDDDMGGLGRVFWREVSTYASGEGTLKVGPRGKEVLFGTLARFDGDPIVASSRTAILDTHNVADIPYRDPGEVPVVSPTKKAKTGQAQEAKEKEILSQIRPVVPGKTKPAPATPRVTHDMGKWIDQVMTEVGGANTKSSRALVKSMKLVEEPWLSFPGDDVAANEMNWHLLGTANPGAQHDIVKNLVREMRDALDVFLETPEGHEWHMRLHKIAKRLKMGSEVTQGIVGKHAQRNVWNIMRLFRAFWPGSRGAQWSRSMWQARAFREGQGAIADILQEIATEPNRQAAKKMFLKHPDILNNVPDKIKRQLGLSPFEEEYEANRVTKIPANVVKFIKKKTGMAVPKQAQQGAAFFPSETRYGPTRYRDRPIVREGMIRAERVEEEKKKERKKKRLRLPRKLQAR